jgi:hypothetical protein
LVPDVPARRAPGRAAAAGLDALGIGPASGFATAFITGFCAAAVAAGGCAGLPASVLMPLSSLLLCVWAEGIVMFIVGCVTRPRVALRSWCESSRDLQMNA